MIHVSKLADYGTVIMAALARVNQAQTAREMADLTQVPLPTVSKLLKALTRAGLLISQRGSKGGYVLARPATHISLAEIIHALEGGVALTECSHPQGKCTMETICAVRQQWRGINGVVRDMLTGINLAALAT